MAPRSMVIFTFVDSFVRFKVFALKLWHALRENREYMAFLDHMVHRKV